MGKGRLSSEMKRFFQVIDVLELKDILLQGGVVTWRGGLNSHRMARLARFLVTEELENHFLRSGLENPPKLVSDASLIMLERRGGRSTPFRSESMWLKEEGLKELTGGDVKSQ